MITHVMKMTGWEANEEVQSALAGRKGRVNGKNTATSEQTHGKGKKATTIRK